jgi:alpha/beta superfamily hydrolase
VAVTAGTELQAPADDAAVPVCLALDRGDVLVMFHNSDRAAVAPTAILMCPPFGLQEATSYRGLRDWARALAAAGYPTARLSLPSTGDSSGGHQEPGRLHEWTSAVAASAQWLRATTAAARVVVIGVGLGALVSWVAVSEGAEIDDLVLWAIPADGRSLLRELRSQSQIVAAAFPEDARDDGESQGELNALGYQLSAETVAELHGIRLANFPLPAHPNRRVLLLARDGIGPPQAVLKQLRAEGVAIEVDDGRDFQALTGNPEDSTPPQASMDITFRWLEAASGARGEHATGASTAGADKRRDSVRAQHGDGAVLETPLWFDGVLGGIFGILTEPASGERSSACVVMVGSGALPHTGPNRAWVEASRRWAAQGLASLRIDLGGIGESGGDQPSLRKVRAFYDGARDREVLAVLDQLHQRGVASRFILGGLCSGAYCALRRAIGDERVTGLLLLNIYAFLLTDDLVAERQRREATAAAVSRIRRRSTDSGDRAEAVRALRPDRAWELLRRPAERRHLDEVKASLETLDRRGVMTLLIWSGDEPLRSALETWRVLDHMRRWPNVTAALLPSRDHMFRAGWLQAQVHRAMDEALTRAGYLAPQTTPGHSLINQAIS